MFKDIWQAMFSLAIVIPLFVLLFILYIPLRVFGIDILKIIEVKIDDVLR